jgi:PAS domain S-box-containing protein
VIILDAFGTIWFANRQVSALFGYAHDEIIGESMEKLMPERFRGRHAEHSGHCVRGLDLYGERRDGTEFPLEINLSPVDDVGRTLVAATLRDATERKRVEAELAVARDAIEALRELADRGNQSRRRILEAAGLDLGQPLQTLAVLNGALRRTVTDPAASEALAQQEQAIAAMSRDLHALLEIGKLDSGGIQPEPADFTVAELFEQLRAEFADIAVSNGIRLEIEPGDGLVHSDPALVEQILRHLVSSAIKRTREGCVRLICRHEGALVRIEVLVTGVGIPADQLPYIFEEHHPTEMAAHKWDDGYGMGLSLVKRLATLLRLELDVRSDAARGSAFTIVLPATPEAAVV